MTYCAKTNGQQGYLDACQHLRRKGLLDGRFFPINADEIRWLGAEMRRQLLIEGFHGIIAMRAAARGHDIQPDITRLVNAMKRQDVAGMFEALPAVTRPFVEARERSCKT